MWKTINKITKPNITEENLNELRMKSRTPSIHFLAKYEIV